MGKIKNWQSFKTARILTNRRSFAWKNTNPMPNRIPSSVIVSPSVRIGGGWNVMIARRPPMMPKNFKTQKEALDFARRYMQKHPRG